MSYDLIDRKDQRIDTIFKGLENMERMIDAIRTAPRPAFHSDYFLTDEELSKLQKVLDDAYKRCREEQRWV